MSTGKKLRADYGSTTRGECVMSTSSDSDPEMLNFLFLIKAQRFPGVREDKKWIRSLTEKFQSIAGEDGEISFDEFKTELNFRQVQ